MGITITETRVQDQSSSAFNIKDIINIVYPVGISIICDHNPQNDYPWQTWVQDFKDRFPLGAGDAYKAGATGGEATHKLTIDEMPSHSHGLTSITGTDDMNFINGSGSFLLQNSDTTIDWPSAENAELLYGQTGGCGSFQPHNNMPPYQAVCYWTRTA